MEKKQNKVKEFVKTHKEEVIGYLVVGTVVVSAFGLGYYTARGRNVYSVESKLGELCREFSDDKEHGRNMIQSLIQFLDKSKSVHPIVPVGDKTLAEAVHADILEIFVENGIEPNSKVSEVLIGLKK